MQKIVFFSFLFLASCSFPPENNNQAGKLGQEMDFKTLWYWPINDIKSVGPEIRKVINIIEKEFCPRGEKENKQISLSVIFYPCKKPIFVKTYFKNPERTQLLIGFPEKTEGWKPKEVWIVVNDFDKRSFDVYQLKKIKDLWFIKSPSCLPVVRESEYRKVDIEEVVSAHPEKSSRE